MNKYALKSIGFLITIVLVSASATLVAASKDDAKAMIKKVEAYYKANGKDKTMAEIQKDKGQFEKGEIYVYSFDLNGTVIAHPKLPTWVGKSFMTLKDTDGKLFIKEAIETLKTKNECWIDYKWNNPEKKKIGLKHGYFVKIGDFILSSGVWE